MSRPGWLLIILGLLTLLVACGRGGEPETPLATSEPTNNNLMLSCSPECLARGQCGPAEDGRNMVLLVRNGPDVKSHDMAVAENILVVKENSQTLTLIETSTNTPMSTDFYQVFVPDRNEQAWVVSWCVTFPP